MASFVTVKEVNEEFDKLKKLKRKTEKKWRHLSLLIEKRKKGEKLEKNQLEQIDSGLKYQLEKELRNYDERRYDVLRSAPASVREAVGACGNCASLSHNTKDCPRSKKVMKQVKKITRNNNNNQQNKKKKNIKSTSLPYQKPIPGNNNVNVNNNVKKKRSSGTPRVLCIAEKPSIAKALAFHMSHGKSRERTNNATPMCKIHEFFTYFPPAKEKCSIICTSVLGHVYGTDFDERDNSTVNPETLYRARVKKIVEELSEKLYLPEHIIKYADDCDYLYLWLDCDNEGENICFEVINLLQSAGMFVNEENIYRAHFSALTEKALRYSFANPIKPKKSVSDSVDARQELDLKIGVTFTRLLTYEFKDGAQLTFKKPKLKVLSYGPCQTPTLNFCVQRHKERLKFRPKQYWELLLKSTSFNKKNICIDEMVWNERNGRTFQKKLALSVKNQYETKINNNKCKVVNITPKKIISKSPEGLNTVALLRTASLSLGMSPKKCMELAEKLYTSGYITYPRTESTKYPSSMDYLGLVKIFKNSNINFIASIIPEDNSKMKLPRYGIDRGDHPPICPTTKLMRVGQYGWNLYEFIVRNFIASLLPPLIYNEIKVTVDVVKGSSGAKNKSTGRGRGRGNRSDSRGGGYSNNNNNSHSTFFFISHTIISPGWSKLLPWRLKAMRLNTNIDNIKSLKINDIGNIKQVSINSDWTKPPEYLKEYELIDAMDKFGIGTDASIPTHVETIAKRGYVKICNENMQVVKDEDDIRNNNNNNKNNNKSSRHNNSHQRNKKGGTNNNNNNNNKRKSNNNDTTTSNHRYMVPTQLGVAVITAFERIDKELILPTLRGNLEKQLVDIASNAKSKDEVLQSTIAIYFQKYRNFAKNIGQIRTLFINKEAAYKMLEQTTKLLSRKLSNLSDFEIRKLEEKEDRVSAIISHYEKMRLEEDRSKLNS